MKPVLSLQTRVTMLVTAAVAVVIGIISTVLFEEMQESLAKNIDQTLKSMAARVLSVIDEPWERSVRDSEIRAIVGLSAARASSHVRVWQDGKDEDEMVSSPRTVDLLGGQALSKVKPPPVGGARLFRGGTSREPYQMLWARGQTHNGVINVALAISASYSRHEMQEYRNTLLLVGGSVLLFSAIAVALLVRLGLKPIGRTTEMLSTVTPSNMSAAEIEDPRQPVELRPFTRAIRDLLERLARSLEQQRRFVADASHELRTPLASLKGALQAARIKDREADQYKETIDGALKDVARMERLIGDLLVLARMDESRELPCTGRYDIAELLAEATERFRHVAAETGARLVLATRPAQVSGNRDLLCRLFGNLVDNALRHGPCGGNVRISSREEPDGVVRVEVHDEGGNIPPEQLARLFERFYRADPSRSQATGGTGLGLSIAREIALRHGGDITIRSVPTEGTTVTVTLPISR